MTKRVDGARLGRAESSREGAGTPSGFPSNRGARLASAAGAAALLALAVLPGWRLGHAAAPESVTAHVAVGDPSPVVYPPPTLPLTFDHARHAQSGIACQRCHAAAMKSLSAKDSLLPGEDTCRPCHDIDRAQPAKVVAPGKPAARCDACHAGFMPPPGEAGRFVAPPPVVIPTAALKFNHKMHAERGIACALCHAGVENVALATTTEMPKMGLCLGCHDGRQATARCAACHVTLPDGRLRTAFPTGMLAPSGSLRGSDAHTTSFRTDHKVAGRDERYCATCHKQNECTDCHGAGVVKPADFHPGDYATLHAIDAKRNNPNCASCHRNQTFCLGCHQRLGVAPDPEGGLLGRQPNNPFGTGTAVKRFHPPGWVRDETGIVLQAPTPASHSFQARRNIRSCVSCHREESCLNCHSADPARSMGANPHWPGFGTSAACRAMASRNARACLKCHAPGAPELSCN